MADAGWHPDPQGRFPLRWFDGNAWTDQVTDGTTPSIDPLVPGAGPVPPMAPGPAPMPPAPMAAAAAPAGKGPLVAVAVLAVLALLVGGFFVLRGGGDDALSADEAEARLDAAVDAVVDGLDGGSEEDPEEDSLADTITDCGGEAIPDDLGDPRQVRDAGSTTVELRAFESSIAATVASLRDEEVRDCLLESSGADPELGLELTAEDGPDLGDESVRLQLDLDDAFGFTVTFVVVAVDQFGVVVSLDSEDEDAGLDALEDAVRALEG